MKVQLIDRLVFAAAMFNPANAGKLSTLRPMLADLFLDTNPDAAALFAKAGMKTRQHIGQFLLGQLSDLLADGIELGIIEEGATE